MLAIKRQLILDTGSLWNEGGLRKGWVGKTGPYNRKSALHTSISQAPRYTRLKCLVREIAWAAGKQPFLFREEEKWKWTTWMSEHRCHHRPGAAGTMRLVPNQVLCSVSHRSAASNCLSFTSLNFWLQGWKNSSLNGLMALSWSILKCTQGCWPLFSCSSLTVVK